MRLLMPIAVFLLLSSLANPIYSQTIINTDTTWSGEITLTEDVEIGAGATLTIEAGAIVDGSGDTSSRYRRLTIVGTLRVNGNPGNFQFVLKDSSKSANISVDLPGSDLSGLVTAINAAGLTISASLSGSTITLTDSKNGPITISDFQIEGITKAEKKPKSFITFNAIDGDGNSLAKEQKLYDYNQSIQSRLDDIKTVQEHLANQRAIIGARTTSLDRQQELIAERKIAIEKDMSDISDADLAALVTQLQSQITSLQASQQAFVKISDLNLFQFIR